MEELWRKIVIDNKSTVYSVSNLGKIRNDLYMRELKGNIANNGYLMVHLHCRIDKVCSVHRLIMRAFCPCDGMDDLQINHKDGNKLNNSLDNLEWCTALENIRHSFEKNLQKKKMRPCYAYDLDGNFLKEYVNALEAEKDLNIDQSSINRCLTEEFSHVKKYQFKSYKKDNIGPWINPRKKPVFLYSLNGDFLRKFDSREECGKVLGINPNNITRYISGERKSDNFIFSNSAL